MRLLRFARNDSFALLGEGARNGCEGEGWDGGRPMLSQIIPTKLNSFPAIANRGGLMYNEIRCTERTYDKGLNARGL